MKQITLILAPAVGEYLEGSYESVVDLMESCDRVVGIL